MDRSKHKQKKEKPAKYTEKDKTSSFITDVRSIKENLKIKEILRTVKMNSSMRIKAPRGSKVMNNKDFNDNECIFDEEPKNKTADEQAIDPAGATNPVMVTNIDTDSDGVENPVNINVITDEEEEKKKTVDPDQEKEEVSAEGTSSKEVVNPDRPACFDNMNETSKVSITTQDVDVAINRDILLLKSRERKLSLDQTMLTRRVSQSELDLYSIGKLPLERKSSFFRKKMDSFLKNTTEIFKKQSTKPSSINRRGSMSASLQSLNESDGIMWKNEAAGSSSSVHSTSTVGRSASIATAAPSASGAPSLSGSQGSASLAGSQPALSASQPLGDSASSINSLNEPYTQDAMLTARAISMSSGLDSATGPRNKRKSNRSNRVTWAASESLANYFKRAFQDERFRETEMFAHSYQDISSIPENFGSPKVDSKGRRLSYQRAVSGEDPMPPRYDSTLRKRHAIPENSEVASIFGTQEH